MSGTMILFIRSAWAASTGTVFVAGAPAEGEPPDGVPPEGEPPDGEPEVGPEVLLMAQPDRSTMPQITATTDVVVLGVQRVIVVSSRQLIRGRMASCPA
jgi:hypothetical protein